MKTKQRDMSVTPGLPPEPAPTSRDANPWPISTAADARKPGTNPMEVHPRARTAYQRKSATGSTPEPRSTGGGFSGWIASLVVVFVAATAIRVAVQSFESGRIEEAIGPLIAVAFAAFLVWRRMRRRS